MRDAHGSTHPLIDVSMDMAARYLGMSTANGVPTASTTSTTTNTVSVAQTAFSHQNTFRNMDMEATNMQNICSLWALDLINKIATARPALQLTPPKHTRVITNRVAPSQRRYVIR